MAPLQAFQPGVESALFFVQQTVEEHNGRLQIILWALLRLPGRPLLLTPLSFHRTIQIAALPFPAIELAPLHQLPQGVLGGHLNQRIQFVDEIPRRGLAHQCRRRVQKRAVPGKLDVVVRPQPQLIITSEGVQGVVGPAMGVAGSIRQSG